jgi:hypothetical protein
MICTKCKTNNNANAQFCETCGKLLNEYKGLNKVIKTFLVLIYILIIACFVLKKFLYIDELHHDFIYNTSNLLIGMSFIIFVVIWFLFFCKKVKLSFTITITLQCVYLIAISNLMFETESIVWILLIFFAAIITAFASKYF